MNRKKLEVTATYSGITILGVLIFLFILGMADDLFNWDVLPPLLDKLAVLILASLSIILVACVLVSIMLNISLIAEKISKIADGENHHDSK
jgi:hypothetical protein